jgi:phosphinothricin acetyltransferase
MRRKHETKMKAVFIRPVKPSDLPEINAIFNYYIAHSTCLWTTIPCTETERKAWYEKLGKATPILVADCGERIVGWSALSSFRAAYSLSGTLEDEIFVHHDFLRLGIGSRLLTELIAAARQNRLRSILAHISADNRASIRLHKKFGFQEVGRIQQVGWKFKRRLDAVYLQLLLKHASARCASPRANAS